MLLHHSTTLLGTCFSWFRQRMVRSPRPPTDSTPHSFLVQCAQLSPSSLPPFVHSSAVATKYLHLLGDLDWGHFPEQPFASLRPGPAPAPRAPFVAAFLVMLNEKKGYMSDLRSFLVEHPALCWLFGFPRHRAPNTAWGFDPEQDLPSRQHFSRVLRELRPAQARFLLTDSLRLLQIELADVIQQGGLSPFGDEISLDTKHILAWVRENNPKEFVPDRYNKDKQPKGDPDCKLGCKRKRNLPTHNGSQAAPTQDGLPASSLEVGDYYWGYASGIVATKVPGWGEFVLAEYTQTFDKSDPSFFFPLMQQVEHHLGRRPRFGAFDGAFDAWYVYEYFHQAGGFAAVPYAGRADQRKVFDQSGAPLCQAGLSMQQKSTFYKKKHCLVPHPCVRFACPLLFPNPSHDSCPIHHPNWSKGGCLTTLPSSIGNRIRHQLDRSSDAYKAIYKQRTATERVNSQAVALNIEQPKLRNRHSIANMNTLRYVLINLKALQRVRQRKRQLTSSTISD